MKTEYYSVHQRVFYCRMIILIYPHVVYFVKPCNISLVSGCQCSYDMEVLSLYVYQVDNKGNHLLVHEESSINVPAIAAAHVIKRYIAQASDELSFEVTHICIKIS